MLCIASSVDLIQHFNYQINHLFKTADTIIIAMEALRIINSNKNMLNPHHLLSTTNFIADTDARNIYIHFRIIFPISSLFHLVFPL